MPKFKYTISIPANSKEEAEKTVRALTKLTVFSPDQLTALASKGPALLSHPVYGSVIRNHLGV